MAPPKKQHVQEELPPPELSHSVCVPKPQDELTAASSASRS